MGLVCELNTESGCDYGDGREMCGCVTEVLLILILGEKKC